MSLDNLAKDLLIKVRQELQVEEILDQLSMISPEEMKEQLTGDNQKKAFWINLYNAINILFLKPDPEVIFTQNGRVLHFSSRKIDVGGHLCSLNFIEHGLLRVSKIRWGRGYLKKPYISPYEKDFRLSEPDPRIHFALNYGATSCPPIRIYSSAKIENQLELAAISFLDSKIAYYAEENIVHVSQLFNWYLGDFGGEKGILEYLRKYQKIPEESNPMIIYNIYNWSPAITFFQQD
ncbi:MAG TPA: DUF547 domain-containing protein [Bacteroidales bacterium]|nr:DUF547 domain-containing protein [Bacteroidales bacterium]